MVNSPAGIQTIPAGVAARAAGADHAVSIERTTAKSVRERVTFMFISVSEPSSHPTLPLPALAPLPTERQPDYRPVHLHVPDEPAVVVVLVEQAISGDQPD